MPNANSIGAPVAPRAPARTIVVAGAIILLAAFGVRLLSWHDTRWEAAKVQSVVADDYKKTGQLISEGGISGFFSSSGSLADPKLLGHPPGYPVVRAVLAGVFGDSDTAVQFFQITCDALAAVVIFLIAIEVLSLGVGLIAGFLAALAPQFAWNSVLLLPDTLAVLPILLATYFLILAVQKQRLTAVIVAGMLIGLSCWLRANALMMGPFLGLISLILFPAERRYRYAGALLLGTFLVVAPLTLRNWIVFQHFIPVSLGAGQTMLEGIADYDPSRRFGIPDTDMGIMKNEAELYNRPDYYSTLFAPDGIKRERMRLARGFGVIRDNPFWFAGVMVRRAGSMLRLERARLISTNPPVSRRFHPTEAKPIWVGKSAELLAQAPEKSSAAQFLASSDGHTLRIVSDNTKYGTQLTTAALPVNPGHDYLFKLPVLVEEGRMSIDSVGENQNVYSSVVVDKAEVKHGDPQPRKIVEVPLVSTAVVASLSFKNAAPSSGGSVVEVGQVELFDLGPSSFLWTRYPRILINSVQRIFITAVMLPLGVFGLAILLKRRQWAIVIILLSVPAYYFCFQSILHTEYRYVLAINYFLFVLAALALYEAAMLVTTILRRRMQLDVR